MTRKLLLAAASGAAMFAAAPAMAQSTTVHVDSTITIEATCTIGGGATSTLIDFGTVMDGATRTLPVDAQNTSGLVLRCNTGALAPTLRIDMGGSDAGDVRNLRSTTDGSLLLPYTLYRDAGRTVPYLPSDRTGLTLTPNVGNSLTYTVTIYGRVAALDINAALPGTYTDRATAIFEY